MQLFGIKTCDTCRKAAKALDVVMRDIRAEPLEASEISRFLAEFGSDLVNKRSTTWRNLDEADRTRTPQELLADHPTLMKRPVFVTEQEAMSGFDDKVRSWLQS